MVLLSGILCIESMICNFPRSGYCFKHCPMSFLQRMMTSLNALAVLIEKAMSNNTSGSATLNLLQGQVL
jgi:hypothetical protein